MLVGKVHPVWVLGQVHTGMGVSFERLQLPANCVRTSHSASPRCERGADEGYRAACSPGCTWPEHAYTLALLMYLCILPWCPPSYWSPPAA